MLKDDEPFAPATPCRRFCFMKIRLERMFPHTSMGDHPIAMREQAWTQLQEPWPGEEGRLRTVFGPWSSSRWSSARSSESGRAAYWSCRLGDASPGGSASRRAGEADAERRVGRLDALPLSTRWPGKEWRTRCLLITTIVSFTYVCANIIIIIFG